MRSLRLRLPMILLLGTAVVVAGCEDEPKRSGRRRGRKSKKKTDAAAAAKPDKATAVIETEKEEPPTFNENFSGRDPFRSYLRDFAVAPGGDDDPIDQIRTHLERFDLSELRPIAIITGTAVPKAMLTDPSGMGHVVQPGTRLGRRGGKVVRISTNTIVIRHVDEEVGTIKETIIRLHSGEDAERYRLNVIRHDLEEDERAKAAAQENVLEGLDVEELLNKDGPAGGQRPGRPPAQRRPPEGGTY